MYVRFPFSLRQVEDLPHERDVDISHETVPELTTLAIFGIGLVGLDGMRRRRKVE